MTRSEIMNNYNRIRAFTEQLCEPLETEDYVIQSMPDVSPTRWHLAHTAWFFETFLLKPELPDYETPNELYNYLFNSYYNAVGKQFSRPERGMLSRPTVEEVYRYRQHIDHEMQRFLEGLSEERLESLTPLIILGLNHEQQHQELMLTDIKHVFFQNPLYPSYSTTKPVTEDAEMSPQSWVSFPGGIKSLGYSEAGFAFDNETPLHEALLQDFVLSSRLVTNGDFLEFINDGGYETPSLWLSDGWSTINREGWQTPLYWVKKGSEWFEFTLSGLLPLNLKAPVTHVSYYEADAFANWAGARLPSEVEWELAARQQEIVGNFVEAGNFHPTPPADPHPTELQQLFGDVWEWTRSPYTPYPGFKAASGAVGEYNGKFMSSQMVLRGGSCVSSQDHIRSTYRNFFYPQSRWQFMGIRLARDVAS